MKGIERAQPPRGEAGAALLLVSPLPPLGSLYFEGGARDEARKVWEKGLSVFPGNRDLAGRLADFPRETAAPQPGRSSPARAAAPPRGS